MSICSSCNEPTANCSDDLGGGEKPKKIPLKSPDNFVISQNAILKNKLRKKIRILKLQRTEKCITLKISEPKFNKQHQKVGSRGKGSSLLNFHKKININKLPKQAEGSFSAKSGTGPYVITKVKNLGGAPAGGRPKKKRF